MIFGRRKPDRRDIAPRRSSQPSEESLGRQTISDLSSRHSFRRNRTLTGSSSAQVASSGELNAELRSPRAHVHHLTSLRRRLTFYFVCVLVAAFGLYLLVSQLVAGLTVKVSGIDLLPGNDKTAYHEAIESYYAARPVERLRFLLNETALTSHVQATRPEVKKLSIEPGSELGQAVAAVVPRHAIARWSFESSERYVDATGVVFSRNYGPAPSLKIVDNSGIEASSSQVVASNRFLSFVGQLISGANGNSLTVAKVTIPAFTTRQVAVTLKGERTEYRLSVDRSVGQQVEDMARVHRYLKRNGITPRYVDIRVEGKAFYK